MRRVDHLIAGLDEAPKRPVQVPLALWTGIELGLLDQQDDAGDLRLAAGFQRLADGGLSQRAIGGRPAEDVGGGRFSRGDEFLGARRRGQVEDRGRGRFGGTDHVRRNSVDPQPRAVRHPCLEGDLTAAAAQAVVGLHRHCGIEHRPQGGE